MSRRARRNHPAAFKAKVVLETARVEQPLTQRAQRLDLHPKWKNQLLDRATEVLAKSSKPADPPISAILFGWDGLQNLWVDRGYRGIWVDGYTIGCKFELNGGL